MRKIPATMATQHPDNARAPFWDNQGDPFISAYQEIHEAFRCFDELGVSEYMWDWEGKHADAAVIDRLFSDYYDYFSQSQLARDKFLTFRIPNIWEEKGYNLLQAMTAIVSAEDFARDLKFDKRPLFEVILPMTLRAEQLMRIHKLFENLAHFKNKNFTKKEPDNNDYLEVIPLVESVESQLAVAELLTKYVSLYSDHFGHKPKYIRTFLACSDSALSSGMLAGIIGNKIALSRLYSFANETGIDIFPIAGCGSLGFRGGLSPETIDRFIAELPGIRTATVQSAFRYDYPKEQVKTAILKLEKELPVTKPNIIDSSNQKELVKISKISAENYNKNLQGILVDMQPIFSSVPKRRDRRQHTGLLAYGRSISGQSLPRAITFSGGFYSVGVPPEFIGLGQTLKSLKDKQLTALHENYVSMIKDLQNAGKFINKNNLEMLAKSNKLWRNIINDIDLTEKILGIKFEPQTNDEIDHANISTSILKHRNDPSSMSQLINKSAILRKAVG